MIVLSNEQTKAFDLIMKWFKSEPDRKTFTLAGYAGTGKTTLAKYIAEEIGNVHFCAFTGKASKVLRDKGCKGAATIHSVIYKLLEIKANDLTFIYEPSKEITQADLIIVDEYSMLTPELINDLEKAGRRILYLGDPFQLPPIGNENNITPDYFMEEIHRQALDSPIIYFATGVREGKKLKYGDSGDFIYQPESKIPREWFFKVDQLIVGYNKTRIKWNNMCRKEKGYTSKLPEKGEKLICLKNNKREGLYNGAIELGRGEYIDGDKILVDFGCLSGLKAWSGDFLGIKTVPKKYFSLNRFDFAYAITCHKSQGSEFDSILVCNEPVGRSLSDKTRWLYTAITRAKEKCILMDSKR